MAVFASRQIVIPATTIAVTITGKGKANYCYATINGTEQYSAGTHEVYAGDTITFGVYSAGTQNSGWVVIDGTEVLKVTDNSTQTYDWIVPSGISTIEIEMIVAPFPRPFGTITVTTA